MCVLCFRFRCCRARSSALISSPAPSSVIWLSRLSAKVIADAVAVIVFAVAMWTRTRSGCLLGGVFWSVLSSGLAHPEQVTIIANGVILFGVLRSSCLIIV